MNNFLENIKLIASELSSMSPRTQLEIVKLCKDLCIETKNYLVQFDETTLPNFDARIEAVETSVSNLNDLYSSLSYELETAEGNIQANANAITTLQGAVETIQTSLTGIYTKTEVDNLLSAKADKLDTYTKTEVNTLLNAKANANDVYSKSETYTKTEVDTALQGKADASNVYTKSETDTLLNAKANQSTTYTKTEVDTALQGKADASSVYTKSETDTLLNAKQNVIDSTHKLASDNVDDTNQTNKFMTDAEKTKLSGIATGAQVNAIESISVNGTPVQPDANKNVNIVAGGGGSIALYEHTIRMRRNTSSKFALIMSIITTNNTAFNANSLKQFLIDNANHRFMCSGNEDFEGYVGQILALKYSTSEEDFVFTVMTTNGQQLDEWNYDDALVDDLADITIADTIRQIV